MDFPDPERPTIAVQEPSEMVRETFRKTDASGRDGYRKLRWWIWTGAALRIWSTPACSWDEACGRSTSRKSRRAISLELLI